eukprot:Hpha_TRINITY_DN12778_c0_g1::TRINITY_DN12778_c0_g1_i1::g.114569::m.114569
MVLAVAAVVAGLSSFDGGWMCPTWEVRAATIRGDDSRMKTAGPNSSPQQLVGLAIRVPTPRDPVVRSAFLRELCGIGNVSEGVNVSTVYNRSVVFPPPLQVRVAEADDENNVNGSACWEWRDAVRRSLDANQSASLQDPEDYPRWLCVTEGVACSAGGIASTTLDDGATCDAEAFIGLQMTSLDYHPNSASRIIALNLNFSDSVRAAVELAGGNVSYAGCRVVVTPDVIQSGGLTVSTILTIVFGSLMGCCLLVLWMLGVLQERRRIQTSTVGQLNYGPWAVRDDGGSQDEDSDVGEGHYRQPED